MTVNTYMSHGWDAELGFGTDRVIAVNDSAIIYTLLGSDQVSVNVRRVDDDALELMRMHRPNGVAVALWYPSSLDGLDRLVGEEVVITSDRGFDPEPLYAMHPSIRALRLFGSAILPGSLDLSRLGRVEEVSAPWRVLDPHASLPPNLESLSLTEDCPSTFGAIPASPFLTSLDLQSARDVRSFDGVERFPALTAVSLSGSRKLGDIEALPLLQSLRKVEFNACGELPSLDPLANLRLLRQLWLIDCRKVPSLRPLARHPELAEILAYGSTDILDGDLSALQEMPALRRLALASRRKYRPSVADIIRSRNLLAE